MKKTIDGNSTPDNGAVSKNHKRRKRNDSNIMRHKKSVKLKPIISRIIVIMYLAKIESGMTEKNENPTFSIQDTKEQK